MPQYRCFGLSSTPTLNIGQSKSNGDKGKPHCSWIQNSRTSTRGEPIAGNIDAIELTLLNSHSTRDRRPETTQTRRTDAWRHGATVGTGDDAASTTIGEVGGRDANAGVGHRRGCAAAHQGGHKDVSCCKALADGSAHTFIGGNRAVLSAGALVLGR